MKIDPQDIYTVSELNAEAREVIEGTFQTIFITGELSNLSKPSSGHLYFSLKDDKAQVSCALFRLSRRRLKFEPENGQQVIAVAQVSLYEARGNFQLIVQDMQLGGVGALQLAFDKLKNKLSEAGLFAEEHKQDFPELPACIGVVTSSSGAALQDILKVLKRRFPSIPVNVYPSLVQGDQAAAQLVKAIQKANTHKQCDVLILARGGGSLEDLWPFNEETVARAIFDSNIPIVTGVGHETDVTIADFVADHRAATPSAAAEFVSPDQNEWKQLIEALYKDLVKTFQNTVQQYSAQLHHLSKRLRHPGQKLREQMQRLDQLEKRLTMHMQTQLTQRQQALQALSRSLDMISPLKTIDRGYAILTDANQHVIRKTTDVKQGDSIHAKVSDGTLLCTVKEVTS